MIPLGAQLTIALKKMKRRFAWACSSFQKLYRSHVMPLVARYCLSPVIFVIDTGLDI